MFVGVFFQNILRSNFFAAFILMQLTTISMMRRITGHHIKTSWRKCYCCLLFVSLLLRREILFQLFGETEASLILLFFFALGAQVLPIAGEEKITSVLAVDEFRDDEYLVLLTQVSLLFHMLGEVPGACLCHHERRSCLWPSRFGRVVRECLVWLPSSATDLTPSLFLSPFCLYPSFAILCLFQKGFIKRTPLATFKSTSNRGLIIISLGEDDTLRWVKR